METILARVFSGPIRIFVEEDLDYLALLHPELLPLLLSFFQLELDIFGFNSSFPIYGQFLNEFQQNLVCWQSIQKHGTCKPAKGQPRHHDPLGRFSSNRSICQLHLRGWHARPPKLPNKPEDVHVLNSGRSSRPPLPQVRTTVENAKGVPVLGIGSIEGQTHSRGRQSHMKSNVASSVHDDKSIPPQAAPFGSHEQNDKNTIQDKKDPVEFGCASDQRPSLSLPYRPQLSTPREAPPHASELPTTPSLPTIQASKAGAPQVATQETATLTCRFNPRTRKTHSKHSIPPRSASPSFQNDSQEDIRTCRNFSRELLEHGDHRRCQEATSQGQAQSLSLGLEHLKPSQSQLVDINELSGIKQAVGDSLTRGGNGEPSSRPSGSASGTNRKHGNTVPSRPPPGGSGGPGGGSGGGGPSDSNLQPPETMPIKKQHNGPPFRCPNDAAKPIEHDRRKCKDWHNSSIAAVTRHVLEDVGKESHKGKQIRALSTAKLDSGERWKRYFVIVNDGVEDPEMNQPYWVQSDPDDTMREILKVLIARPDSGTEESATTVQLLHQYQTLLARKEQSDRQIRARCEAAKAAAMETEQRELEQSQSAFNVAFEDLMVDLAENGSQIMGTVAMNAPAARGNQDLQGLTSPLHGNLDIDAEITTAFESAPNLPQLLMPMQGPPNYGNTGPNLNHGNLCNMNQQPLNDFFRNTDVVMSSETNPEVRQRVQRRQNIQHQRTQMLRPGHYHPYLQRDSALGSSRRSAADASSAGSPDNASMYSFEAPPPPSMSSAAFLDNVLDESYIDFGDIPYGSYRTDHSYGSR